MRSRRNTIFPTFSQIQTLQAADAQQIANHQAQQNLLIQQQLAAQHPQVQLEMNQQVQQPQEQQPQQEETKANASTKGGKSLACKGNTKGNMENGKVKSYIRKERTGDTKKKGDGIEDVDFEDEAKEY